MPKLTLVGNKSQLACSRKNIIYINSTIHCCTDWVQQLCSENLLIVHAKLSH